MIWVELQAVLALHEDLLEQHGGLPGTVDRGKLEAALERPQNLVHYEGVEDPAVLAAAYLIAVAKAHAFTDANKRTAWMTAALFLELNNFGLEYEVEDALDVAVGAAVARSLDEIATWYSKHIK